MRMNLSEVERRITQLIHAWRSSCPEQIFADMTLEQFSQAVQACLDAKAKMAAADAQWDATRKERNEAYARVVELMMWVVSSVRGNPKFGPDSAVYAAMGYVPKSERSSGLTRRRSDKEEGTEQS